MEMNKSLISIFLCLGFWVANNFSTLSAIPQQGKTFDLGVYKVGVDTDDGFAVRREINFDTPFFKIHKKGEIGFGNAIVNATDSDSEEDSAEDQSLRQKREAIDHKSTQFGNLKRTKRAPCFYGVGGTTPTQSPADVEEARRRRSVAGKALKKAKTKGGGGKSKGGGGKSKCGRRRRRRREAEIEKFNNEIQNVGKNVGDHVDQALEKARIFWQSITQMTQQFTETARNTFGNTASG